MADSQSFLPLGKKIYSLKYNILRFVCQEKIRLKGCLYIGLKWKNPDIPQYIGENFGCGDRI
jgi:hypothetical protein